jgi:hypothetical protein
MSMTTLSDTVTTRYVGATDTRGSHYVVTFRGHARRVPYSYEARNAAEHAAQWVVDQYVENGHVLYAGMNARQTGNRYFVNVMA